MSQESTRQCPTCYGRVTDDGAAVCPDCKAVYHAACLTTGCVVAGCKARAPRPGGATPDASSQNTKVPAWKLRALELTLAVLAIGLLASIAIPNFQAMRSRESPRSCYANQKTIVGAIEMYNLDKNTKRTTLDGAFFQALKSGGYLQSIPQDPGQGPGTSSNYLTTDTKNGIKCTVHGGIQ